MSKCNVSFMFNCTGKFVQCFLLKILAEFFLLRCEYMFLSFLSATNGSFRTYSKFSRAIYTCFIVNLVIIIFRFLIFIYAIHDI